MMITVHYICRFFRCLSMQRYRESLWRSWTTTMPVRLTTESGARGESSDNWKSVCLSVRLLVVVFRSVTHAQSVGMSVHLLSRSVWGSGIVCVCVYFTLFVLNWVNGSEHLIQNIIFLASCQGRAFGVGLKVQTCSSVGHLCCHQCVCACVCGCVCVCACVCGGGCICVSVCGT